MTDTDEFLAHYGIKGMKWGVRKDRESKDSPSSAASLNRQTDFRKAAIVLGSVAGIAAIGVGAYYVSQYSGSPVPKSAPDAGKKLAEALSNNPATIMHASRAKNHGFTFLMDGGISDHIQVLEDVFGADGLAGNGLHVGERTGLTGLSFNDPLGRKDFAGRTIPHKVVFPRDISDKITDEKQAEELAWSMIKDTYQVFYDRYEDRDSEEK